MILKKYQILNGIGEFFGVCEDPLKKIPKMVIFDAAFLTCAATNIL